MSKINNGGNIMAVKIRLKRMGAKKSPFYRIVAADSRMPRAVSYTHLCNASKRIVKWYCRCFGRFVGK